MENNFKITVPKPCHEDWDKMTPDQTGRFCNSCVKSVVDFTNMDALEIKAYFIKNQGKNVCGRFKNEQLDSVIIHIPKEILFTQVKFHKIFLLALLVSMPGIMSSQNTDGSKQKIQKVEVVDSISESEFTGKAKIAQKETTTNVEMTAERKAKMEELKRRREELKKNRGKMVMGRTAPRLTTTGDVAIIPDNEKLPEVKKDFYHVREVEKAPEYPVGIWEFYEYFNHNFKVAPEDEKITQRLFVSFIIESDGSLSDIKILRGINERMDAETLRVLKSCPKWIPGELNDKKVRVLYSLPIKITAKE